ncbi:MAG: hypothetical protein U0736_08455 [Gemmataceae bacterium]
MQRDQPFGAVLWAVRPEGKAAAPPKDKAAPPARPDDTFEPLRGTALRQVLGETFDFHGVDDPKATLGDVLAQMTRKCGVQFDIHSNALVRGEGDNVVADPAVAPGTPLPRMKTSLRNVLRQVLRRVDPQLTYLVRSDTVEIVNAQTAREELRLSDEEPLPSLVTEDFQKESLTKALDRIAEATDTTVVVDVSCQEKAKLEVSARLTNVPVDTAVRLLANMVGLDVTRVNNALYVTTSEKATGLQKALIREAHGPLAPGVTGVLGGFGGLGGLGGAGIMGGVPGVPAR